jgi:hypothetical protein
MGIALAEVAIYAFELHKGDCMNYRLRTLGLAVILIAIIFVPPSGACFQQYCSVNCGGSEYLFYGLTAEQCCSYPYTPYECPNGAVGQATWYSGCVGRPTIYC